MKRTNNLFFSLFTSALLMLSIMAITATMMTTTTAQDAHALRFDPETGKGFVSRGEIKSVMDLSEREITDFDELVARTEETGEVIGRFLFKATSDVLCSDGTTLAGMEYGGGGTLETEVKHNNQGELTGVQFTGYLEQANYPPDLVRMQLERGPVEECEDANHGTTISHTLLSIDEQLIDVLFYDGAFARISSNSIMNVYDIDEINNNDN